jgi:exodeoxyribonuclease VIII
MDYYDDVSWVSNSMLGDLKKSPRMFQKRYVTREIGARESAAFDLGSLTHAIALEPSTVPLRFVIKPEGIDRRTKAGKEAWEAFVQSSGDRKVIDNDTFKTAFRCGAALNSHPEISTLLSLKNPIIEERIDFEWFGVQCKCKPDLVLPSQGIIVDIKTTKDASPAGFRYSVEDYGYHRQAAFYLEACQRKYEKDFRFLFACVETAEPFEAAMHELDYLMISVGRKEIYQLINEYKFRKETNDWSPAWSKGINLLSGSKYYKPFVSELEEVA